MARFSDMVPRVETSSTPMRKSVVWFSFSLRLRDCIGFLFLWGMILRYFLCMGGVLDYGDAFWDFCDGFKLAVGDLLFLNSNKK